ncbi:hypothetical protein [Streptomyces mirabilis]|uniref:hypothetical protein n=1 Tax=Streptomyces mirabilis TaxID=68239 RepID=UPI0033BD18E6
MQLTAVVLATYTSGAAGSTEMEVLARLCGHSLHQVEELLDRLVASRSVAAWHYCRDTDEVAWRLSLQVRVGRAAVQQWQHNGQQLCHMPRACRLLTLQGE